MLESVKNRLRSSGQLTPETERRLAEFERICVSEIGGEALRAALAEAGLSETTDIVISADHGFSTISKDSQTSAAAKINYKDVPAGQLPPGFVAIDIAVAVIAHSPLAAHPATRLTMEGGALVFSVLNVAVMVIARHPVLFSMGTTMML